MGILDALRGPSEAEKTQEIKDLLTKELGGELKNIQVDYDKGGSVKVMGEAKWFATKERVETLVNKVKGVKTVDTKGINVKKEQPAPAAAAKTAAPAAQTYTIKSGDTLSKIAREHYGDANQWNRIFEANKDVISDPDKIYPGQTITIPK